MRSRRIWYLAIAIGAIVTSLERLHGAELSAPEYKLKAGFIYNFAKLTTWPTSAFASCETPFRIGVVGGDGVFPFLEEETRTRLLSGREVKVVRINTPAEAAKCHLLYLSTGSRGELSRWLLALKGQPVLTVGEEERFTERGGMIRLFRESGALRFEVRMLSVERAGLTVSSKLLSLSKLYLEKSP